VETAVVRYGHAADDKHGVGQLRHGVDRDAAVIGISKSCRRGPGGGSRRCAPTQKSRNVRFWKIRPMGSDS
jgi:hypothetical protein